MNTWRFLLVASGLATMATGITYLAVGSAISDLTAQLSGMGIGLTSVATAGAVEVFAQRRRHRAELREHGRDALHGEVGR